MKKTLLGCILSALTVTSFAQGFNLPEIPVSELSKINGYVIDSWGHAVRSSDGSCVRAGSYNALTAYHPECDIRKEEKVLITETRVEVTEIEKVKPVERVYRTHKEGLTITFGFDSAVLTQKAKDQIDDFIENTVSQRKESMIRVVSGADFIGSEDYNMKLSANRSLAIATYLAEKGINNIKSVVGVGEELAKLQNTEECKPVRKNHNKLVNCISADRFGTIILIYRD